MFTGGILVCLSAWPQWEGVREADDLTLLGIQDVGGCFRGLFRLCIAFRELFYFQDSKSSGPAGNYLDDGKVGVSHV